jgi:peptidoglycan hydrolase-like protein with peptidoglycan-binding domain
MTFTPRAGWAPYSTVTVKVPAGVTGASAASSPTVKATTTSFVAAPGSVLRLQQLLAELGYLPVSFAPTGSSAAGALAAEPTTVADVSTSPVPGAFTWSYPNTPASLVAQWNANAATAITRGAVMAFEADHGLASDGSAGAGVWSVLLASVATHAPASHPYTYLMVSEVQPENLQVWEKGAIVATTLVNTGAWGAATAKGTFPVFEHLASTTMQGTNPDGSKYKDYGVKYVAYFNGGDAVHQFYRPGYGYPQSNGCVELPASSAATVWDLDPLGTLVTVA